MVHHRDPGRRHGPHAGRAADQVITFESFGLGPNSYLNDAPSGQFVTDGTSFNNSYDSTFGTWSGWSISTMTDTTTPDYTNQYSAITGSGAGGSATYAVAYTFGNNTDPFNPSSSYINLPAGMTARIASDHQHDLRLYDDAQRQPVLQEVRRGRLFPP